MRSDWSLPADRYEYEQACQLTPTSVAPDVDGFCFSDNDAGICIGIPGPDHRKYAHISYRGFVCIPGIGYQDLLVSNQGVF